MDETILRMGTIVKLRNEKQLFMIIGHSILETNNENLTIYKDYMACCFPQGATDFNHFVGFDNNDIETILYNGVKSSADYIIDEAILKSREKYKELYKDKNE